MKAADATESAKELLKLHGGSCSVPHSSPLHRAFFKMAEAGEVTLTGSSTPGFVNIYSKDFKPRFFKKEE